MWNLPSGLLDTFDDGVNTIIEFFGKTCVVVYEPSIIDCPNCLNDIFTGSSANRYTPGGPIPFADGTVCPFCRGAGTIPQEQTENIKLRVYGNPKDWINVMPSNIEWPDGTIQTWGYIRDMPKLQRCVELRRHIGIAGYGYMRYRRAGEIVPHGLGRDHYCIGLWKRIP